MSTEEETYPTLEEVELNVKVSNWPQPVENVAPEHTVTMTFTDTGKVLEILQLNPLRERATLTVQGAGTVTICHSQADANAALNGVQSAGIPFTNVAATPSIVWEYFATAKLWAVITGAATLGVLTESRTC